jgi:ATP-dependent protease ClpP protease subunit
MKQSQVKTFDEDMLPSDFGGQCEVFVNSQTYYSYDVFLDEEIREPSYYRQALKTIRDASEGDLVKIHLATPGGNLTTALMLISAIEESSAEVVAIVEGECYSGGSLIALSCPVIDVKPGALFMLHSASFGSSGSVQTVRDHVNFIGSHAEKVMEEIYKDFITEEELEDLKRGRELWFDADQISERLEKMFEDRNEAIQAELTLEGLVKKAVKEALSELNPTSLSIGGIPPEEVDAFNKFVVTGATSVSGQIENGKSPETAFPYPVDAILERGVWYKWEAGEDAEGPPIQAKMTGSILWGDGELTERDVLSYYCWGTQPDEDCTIKAFKIDIEQ